MRVNGLPRLPGYALDQGAHMTLGQLFRDRINRAATFSDTCRAARETMRPRTIKTKVGLYLTLALTVAMVLFCAPVLWYLRGELLSGTADYVTQLSEVITRSTRFAMLQNQPAYVDHILHDVALDERIDRLRILSKDGKIIDSTFAPEVGRTIDRDAEACVLCHESEKPRKRISATEPLTLDEGERGAPRTNRTWTFTTPEGQRRLGSMQVIHNEPACYNAACHQHSPSASVLGVLDIVYSIDKIESRLRTSALTIAGFSLGFIALASLLVGIFIHRLVYVPLRDLESGAHRLADGNLEQAIPVRSGDEFGELAASFNVMTAALRNSRSELREWARTLEEKVEQRTEQLRIAQANTIRGEKLASVGLLVSGIAHELNNPLTGILTFSTLLRQNAPDGSPEAEDLDLVIKETKRCAGIIKRLLDFAREKPPEKRFADLNQIIEGAARIVEWPAHLRNIETTLDLDRSLPPIWVDADQIQQVVMNMLVNAQHAIDEKGSITIHSGRAGEPKRPEPDAPPIAMAEFSVIDTGCGIPEANLGRIFDPFFTSKEVGKGTGLGLSVSHGIVKAHGGLIEVTSKVGEGSTFRVLLPLEPPADATANKSGEGKQ